MLIKVNNQFNNNILVKQSFEDRPNDLQVLIPGFMGAVEDPPCNVIFGELQKSLSIITFNFIGLQKGAFPTIHECLDDFEHVLQYYLKVGVQSFNLIGHSLGGVLCLQLASLPFWNRYIKKIILLSTPASTQNFGTRHTLVPSLTPGFMQVEVKDTSVLVQQKFIDEMLSLNVLDIVKKIQAQTLIIHGRLDKIVPYHEAQTIYDALHSIKQIQIMETAGHKFSNSETQRLVAKIILNFILL